MGVIISIIKIISLPAAIFLAYDDIKTTKEKDRLKKENEELKKRKGL